ncbi:rho GTPase-activating protein 32 isoform X2 [Salvelinus fontinalis]|uniref:rho GTPase-activating protein 32 isoform X2 n=1 Tax=Salvelinus fontinalis TaxID=8038 RepID=UPI0024860FA9|nr:rho GTPase-activating protein 32 isoform X2 [Salvelinus fontinalis]
MEAGSGAAAAVGSAALGLHGATEAASHDISDRGLRPGRHPEDDDIVPELARLVYPRERPDWEETISAMARSAEVPELSTEPLLRSCSSTASMKVKNVKKLSFTKGHFPKLAECAHFHYENVDFGAIQLSLADEQSEVTRNGFESKELQYLVQIYCQGRNWIVKRSYEDFRVLDKHLHLCIYDRRFSQLPELPRFDSLSDRAEAVSQMLMAYLSRLTAIADNKINCGPALTWMEVDNKGNHLLVHEESSINVPAIAAAHVIKRYIAQAADELSFEVGDIVSVIDMPPKEDTTWWRGKHGFQVGFFPSECVELINDKVPQSVTNSVPKPDLEMESVKQDSAWVADPLNHYSLSSVSKKHGKLITFLRTFMKSRPTKQKLKQRGILRERVFGCDLGEHLLNSGHDVPQVLKSCTEFIEKHGVVDGMYRLSGIASNIQKLRHEFDSEQIPDLTKDVYIQDIHCVGSLCKLYFRELPNPLLTYQLYEKFSEAVSAATDEERLIKIHDVIQQLPPPHYRTLEFLMRHLSQLATFSYITNMHSKNLAIVWAPNLLRSKQIESACFSGTAAFMEVRIQSVVVEFILNHVDVLFSPKLSSLIREGAGHNSLLRPKSLLVSSPSTKLLTLEEAQARTQAQINSPVTADSKYIEVGEGPAALQGKFHTVIEFPMERKRPPIKSKKSPVGNWRSFFNLGKSSSMSKRKLHRNPSEPSELKAMALAGGRGDTGTLRSAKSEESLTSLHNVEGESKVYRPRRPRSSSDALSASFNGDLLDSHTRQHCNSDDNLAQSHSGGATREGGDSDGDDGPIYVPALISPPRSAGEDVDLSPPDIGMASLDFDPMSFQCSLPDGSFSFPLGLSDVATGAAGEGTSLKRSPGSVDNGSALVSPSFLGKFANPFLSPDLSPATGEKAGSKKLVCSVSFSDKPVQAVSPKKSKSDILAPLAISEPFDMEISSRLTESHGVPQPSSPPSGLPWDSPLLMGSVLLRTGEPSLSEAFQMELHCKLSAFDTESQDSTGEESTAQQPTATNSKEQLGAVASLDSPKASPGPLSSSSVSLLPPPPPPKNAARMLALALAESAQQASILTQKRPSQSQPPTPVSPIRPLEPSHSLDWPPPPALRPQTSLKEGPRAGEAQTPTLTPTTPNLAPSPPPPPTTPTDKQPCQSVSQESISMFTSAKSPSTSPGASQDMDFTPPASPHHQCTTTPYSPPAHVSPTRKSPDRQQPAMGQVAVSSTGFSTTTPRSREMGVLPQPAPEVHVDETVWSPSPKPSEQRVAVSQPQIQFHTHPQAQSQPQPQPHSHPQPNARVVPTPSESVERPWQAIKPVQPGTEPVTHAHGPTPPAPPVRSIESKLATAALSHTEAANPAIFHNILTEVSTPEEALAHPHPPPRKSSTQQSAYLYNTKGEAALLEPPGEAYYHQRAIPVGQPSYHYRPDSVPPHLSYASKSAPQITYSARTDHRYNTLANPRSCHQSMKHHGPPRSGEYISTGSGHHGQGYGPMEGAPVYPTIRRVHSLHVPSAIRSVPIQRTEVPPNDELFYYQRPVYQCNTYQQPPQQSSQADYHVTQLQPYFENGRVQYRYSPYSPCANPLDAPYYDVDPYGTIRLRHFHSFSSRDLGPTLSRSGGKAGGYHYLSRHILPPGKEHSFVSRDMPPGHGSKGAAVYFAWNPEDSERLRMHSIHRESRARQKVKGPVMSQYDNVGLFMPGDLGGYETLHLRSKSDPGKAMLMTVEGKDGRYGVPPGSQHAPRHLVSDPDVLMYMETEKHCQGNGTGDKHSNSRTCQVSHSHQAQHPPRYQAHQQDPSRHDPGDGARSFQPRYEQPDPDRHQNRSKTPGSYQDNDDHQHKSAPVKAQAPLKPERSHSMREHQQQHYSQAATSEPDRDHSYQPHGGQQRHSTMAIQSHYDNLDDYHPAAIPQPQAPMPNPRGVSSASFPTNPGFTGSHSNRAYSTALGQGAFIPAELALQRPETEIHAE